jgi:CDP-glucose 4,6-dehydratase
VGIGRRAVAGLVSGDERGALFGGVFSGRRVLVTGHTGFKGSWLASWLLSLGAHVTGYALEPPTVPSLFAALHLADHLDDRRGDVRDLAHMRHVLAGADPEVVFHLAAQPLVRRSYAEPVETFATNVMGTANLLEAVRSTPSVRVVVNVTSDKCYENREWEYAYRENDPMGGHDPYSASKGCSELVTAAYQRSFFNHESGAAVATARAGNVIGGGDWAADRIVPDCVRALLAREPVVVRNPLAVRPWQHVLEPLAGYLLLAAGLLSDPQNHVGPWNFGPSQGGNLSVREVVETVLAEWGEGTWTGPPAGATGPREARFLKLDCSKASDLLGWRSVWSAERGLRTAVGWYRGFCRLGVSATELTADCLSAYVRDAAGLGVSWASGAQ